MKLSLAWIFDHIDADWKKQDLNQLISKFNTTTAEIESFHNPKFDITNFYFGKITQSINNEVKFFVPELQKEIDLPLRDDPADEIFANIQNPILMIKKRENIFYWANLVDFGLEKTGLLPAFDISDQDLTGNWRKKFENEDVILEIDNKSITHRPDMWGHRGFAREIAALLNLPFKNQELFLKDYKITYFDGKSKVSTDNPIVIENKAEKKCKQFSGLYFKSIENKPSDVFTASRLLKVGQRPINGIIDLTNYIALEWSQPVHAYDTKNITDKKIEIRLAKNGEKITLLDGNELELTNQDLVVANGKIPMCLAGVRGEINSSINNSTYSIFFESANFDATTVRRSALRHKTRTDSSARFEKSLDPNQTTQAIQRFLKLLDKCQIKAEPAPDIIAIEQPVKEKTIKVNHDFLEKRSGITLKEQDVINPLTKIGFKVSVKNTPEITYEVTVPTFRGSKDIKIKEDILEEVVRFYGLNNIPLILPKFVRKSFNLSPISRLRKIKNYLVNCAKMIEQQNYVFFDEEFLTELNLSEQTTVNVINPVSQNNYRLVNSLIPGLFKNIKHNHVHHNRLAFFEFAKIWDLEKNKILEQKSLAGIFFEKHSSIDFYRCKQHIIELLKILDVDINRIEWEKLEETEKPWFRKYQTTKIIFDGKTIGIAGNTDPLFLNKLKIHEQCSAFIFELDGNWLINPTTRTKYYTHICKFQESYFDLSLLVPLTMTTKLLQDKLYTINPLIKKVELIDFFEKDDWVDVRSETFRIWLENPDKTLEKEEIDAVTQETIKTIQTMGVKLRA